MKKTILLSFILLCLSAFSFSQEKNACEMLINIIDMARHRSDSLNYNISDIKVEEIESSLFFDAILKFKKDTSVIVRELMYSVVVEYGLHNKDSLSRRKARNFILNSFNDPAVAWQNSSLKKFDQRDYDLDAKNTVRKLICCKKNVFSYSDICLLAGYLDLKDQIPVLDSILYLGKIKNKKLGEDIHMALARLGVESEIDTCISIVEFYPDDEKVINGFDMLSYIKHPKILNYFRNQFYYGKGEVSNDPNFLDKKIKISNYALKYLIMMIENFPLISYREMIYIKDEKRMLYKNDEIINLSRKWIETNFDKAIIDNKSFYAHDYEEWPEK